MTNAKKILDDLKAHYRFRTFGQLADFLGVKPNTLSSWIARNSIDADLIFRKCEGISYEWVRTGEGSMWRSEAPQKVGEQQVRYEVTTVHRTVSLEIAKLLDALEVFPDVREAMEAFIALPPRKQKIYLGKLLEEVDKMREAGELFISED